MELIVGREFPTCTIVCSETVDNPSETSTVQVNVESSPTSEGES